MWLARDYALAVAPRFAVRCPRWPLPFTSRVWSATYVAAYNPLFGGGVPYSGEMKLTFNHGIIAGTYSATSTRPDPLYGRIINVTGTVQHGNINLTSAE